MKVLGIVVLYYPDADIVSNIRSYLDAVDKLIVWDNTPVCSFINFPKDPKIIQMGNAENAGIGKALNEAVGYAEANGFTHLLTMDQDSYFENDSCKTYLAIVENAKQKAIFSPNYIVRKEAFYTSSELFLEVETSMTSGSLYPLSVFEETGRFREDFFIDLVDSEFSLRAKQKGIPTLAIPSIRLIHGLGYQKKKHKFLWKVFFPNEYSPIRSYYIVRNGIIAKKLYPEAEYFKGHLFYWFYKRMFFVLCYEENKWEKWKALICGYIHGKMGKTGKQTVFEELN
jgi:rhamnosyltransferase